MSQTDERAEGRVKALLRARLSGYGFERDACVLDLSPQGLLVTTALPPRPAQVVTVSANGYTMTGEVKWVGERRFGVELDDAIEVAEVIEARNLGTNVRPARAPLPENFGIRPERASAAMSLVALFESQWARYAVIVVVGGALAIYAGMFASKNLGSMAEQMASVQDVAQAEGNATAK